MTIFKKLLFIGCAIVSFSVSAEENYTFDQEITCLADNMYWEARNQSFAGQVAVGNVVINRVEDPRFPDQICEVVKQGPTKRSWSNPTIYYPIRDRCQFSWYCDGKSDEIPEEDYELYNHLRAVAVKIHGGWFGDNTFGATHYHAYYVKPEWASSKTKTTRIGAHIFYKWEK